MKDPSPPIPFLQPELPPLERVVADLGEIYRSGVFSNGGAFEARLVRGLGELLAGAHPVPVASGTLGLVLAARLQARQGGRRGVLLPSFTFPATALAAEWAGLTPVFCDVDPESWQPSVDPDLLRRQRDEFALVLLCNTFGAPCDLPFWRETAASCGLPLLVDSAAGLGGRYPDGRPLGAAGAVEVFSMQATKTFAVGEGGVVATPDPEQRDALLRLRNFGLDEDRVCRAEGTNAKLSEIHAAIGCRVLEGFAEILEARRRVAARYRSRLEPHGLRFQKHGELSPWPCVSVLLPRGVDRGALQERMLAAGIETRHYFDPPLHRQPRWRGHARLGELAATEAIAGRILSLPTANRLTPEQVDRVCDALIGGL